MIDTTIAALDASDKLMVQVDGLTVYNPMFVGVFWDMQDLMLERYCPLKS